MVLSAKTGKSFDKPNGTALYARPDAKFIQFELDKERQAMCKVWCNTLEELDDCLSNLVSSGYQLSVREDKYNKCFAAWILPKDDKNPNTGLILPGRGSTACKAIKQALYKHYVLCDGQSWNILTTDYTPEIDD